MADTPRTQLERAYRLIQQERLDEASALLQPLVKKEPNNADAWWLLANAVTEPEDARNALENVLRLTPNHAEARELLDQLNAAVSPADDFGDIDFDDPFAGLDAKPNSTAATDLNTLFDDDVPSFVRESGGTSSTSATGKAIRDFTTEDDEMLLAALDAPTREAPSAGKPAKQVKSGNQKTEAKPNPLAGLANNRRLLLPLGLVAIILVILVVVVVILPALNPLPPTATTVAVASTIIPSVATSAATTTTASTAVATANAVTAIPTTIQAASIPATANVPAAVPSGVPTVISQPISLSDISTLTVSMLKAAGIENAQVNVVLTSLGQTLTARFCGPYGPKLDGKVRSAMDIVAVQGAKVSNQIQGIGVEVDNCSDQTQIYAKAISTIQDVVAYVNKTLPAGQFRSNWKTS